MMLLTDNEKLMIFLWLAGNLDRNPHLCSMLVNLMCYNDKTMSSRPEQEQCKLWTRRSAAARDLARRERERRGLRSTNIAACDTLRGLVAEELGLFRLPPEPPPRFLEQPDVDEDGLEINHPLTSEERAYVNEVMTHEKELRQYVRRAGKTTK